MELLLHQCRGAECYRCYYYNNNIESYAREMAKMNKPLRVINVKDMLAMAPEEWAKICPPKPEDAHKDRPDRKSTRLNSSHLGISYAVFCLKKQREGSRTGTGFTQGIGAHRVAAHARQIALFLLFRGPAQYTLFPQSILPIH